MHNLLPARGALVRDCKAWADYLTESIRLFAHRSDVMFAAHGIPRFGTDEIVSFLTSHRDAYKFLHDQTVRRMNAGATGTEIAEELALPDVLRKQWFNRGYYGTMSHNSKAVYQRYMGWYDANPVNLNPLPPEPIAKRYVAAMGGAEAVVAEAGKAVKEGELRWAATLLNHVVFADAENKAARNLLADVYTRMGFESEAGTWRNIYLTGAAELRDGVIKLPPTAMNVSVLQATTTPMLLDFAAVRINPDKATAKPFRLVIHLTDRKETILITVGNGVMVHEHGVTAAKADATFSMTRPHLLMTLFAGAPAQGFIDSGEVKAQGDASLLASLADLIEPLDTNFNIVTP
jgi:alkyl sulfatase BDS1-like metallo-beta-lactamase superfamily hydrolase